MADWMADFSELHNILAEGLEIKGRFDKVILAVVAHSQAAEKLKARLWDWDWKELLLPQDARVHFVSFLKRLLEECILASKIYIEDSPIKAHQAINDLPGIGSAIGLRLKRLIGTLLGCPEVGASVDAAQICGIRMFVDYLGREGNYQDKRSLDKIMQRLLDGMTDVVLSEESKGKINEVIRDFSDKKSGI